jgi:catechol 2,3-dioxygenase-like lactoylglutathione lyase family enzyme
MAAERNHSLTAILPCTSVQKSRAFYERLGFRQVAGNDQYAMLQDPDGAEIHLQPTVDGWLIPTRNPFGLYLYTKAVDELAANFQGEILGNGLPEKKPWGMYEFALSDPDETLIRIGWPTASRT